MDTDRFIIRHWLTAFWELVSPKSVEYAGRLETQGKVDIATQAQRQSGSRILPSSGNLSLFYLKALNWLDETHQIIMENNLL